MSEFFKPYEGKRPFLFISYAHRQSDQVVDTVRILHDKGYRLWYDEGIPAGNDWPATIARHMQSCERVVFFLSERALESPNCFSEMNAAARQKKPVLLVWLEETEVPERWRELLAGKPEIPLLPGAAERAEAILRSGFVPRRFHASWREKIPWRGVALFFSALLFLAAAGGLGALATGRWEPLPAPEPSAAAETPAPEPVPTAPPILELGEAERYFAISIDNAQVERAIRRALGQTEGEIYRWQLAEITQLHFCGNMVLDGPEAVTFDADGVCRVNGAPVIRGSVSELKLVGDMARLESLSLICQPVKDISDLSGLTALRELNLSGSAVGDLRGLGAPPSLETLHLEYTDVADLTPLEALPNLKTVTVSRSMLPLTWSEAAPFDVILAGEN